MDKKHYVKPCMKVVKLKGRVVFLGGSDDPGGSGGSDDPGGATEHD